MAFKLINLYKSSIYQKYFLETKSHASTLQVCSKGTGLLSHLKQLKD